MKAQVVEVFNEINMNIYEELAIDRELSGCRCPNYLLTLMYCGPRQTVRTLATLI